MKSLFLRFGSLGIAAVQLCLLLLLSATLLVSPVHAETNGFYQVRGGDNLTHIARRFGVTVDQIKSTNQLKNDVLHIGQKLKIAKPFSSRNSRKITWSKPCPRVGQVLKPFGQYKRKGILMPQTGAEIACEVGTQVKLPADGIVRHIGPLEGFGTLVIIEHADRFATVLAPLDPDTIRAKVGDALRRGDPLGKTALPEDDRSPYLHVELRHNDKAVAPDRLLK